MNMYRDSYVVALMANGRILKEEQDGSVLVPFGAEYVIRLKNKLRKKAVADVWLDGRIACKGIVVDANGTVDLERFVDGNLTEGRRFKLVRATDSGVAQPNDSENGTIEVNFYPEKDQPVVTNQIVNTIIEHKHHSHIHCTFCCNDIWCHSCHSRPMYGNVLRSTGLDSFSLSSSVGYSSGDPGPTGGEGSSKGIGQGSVPLSMNMCAVSQAAPSTVTDWATNSKGEDAATIEGSKSFQRFSTVHVDYDRDHPVTIRMKLRGVNQILEVCNCGFKRQHEKFCPSCGTQLAAA